ncbi:hypothetical protein IBX73_11700, partial [candidate division WOR-3 bacterium]|nr:hypothetical protein [candidate division WOR-3 bacterium]
WKGYPFEIINALVDKDDLRGSSRAKSVMITEQGAKRAEQLKKKYLWTEWGQIFTLHN